MRCHCFLCSDDCRGVKLQGVDDMERQARQCAEEQLVAVTHRLAVAEEAVLHHRCGHPHRTFTLPPCMPLALFMPPPPPAPCRPPHPPPPSAPKPLCLLLIAPSHSALPSRRDADEAKDKGASLQRRLDEERLSHAAEHEGLKARLKEVGVMRGSVGRPEGRPRHRIAPLAQPRRPAFPPSPPLGRSPPPSLPPLPLPLQVSILI